MSPYNVFDAGPAVELRQALALLKLRRPEAARIQGNTVDWLNAVADAEELVVAMRAHPLRGGKTLPSRRVRPVNVKELASQLIAGRPYADALAVAAVPGVDATVLAQLLTVGLAVGPAPAPTPTVGVLLPLRLETKFTPPVGLAGWVLRVRVIPDVLSVDRHDPLPSVVELDSVEAFWRHCDGDLSTPQGEAEWRALCARQGVARAAWLARTFPPVTVDGQVTVSRPADIRTEPRIAVLAGIPPTIELWLARAGGQPAKAATFTVDPTLLLSDLPTPDVPQDRWWSSYATAVQAGLAGEIDLGPPPTTSTCCTRSGSAAATRRHCSVPTGTPGCSRCCRWAPRPTAWTATRRPTSRRTRPPGGPCCSPVARATPAPRVSAPH